MRKLIVPVLTVLLLLTAAFTVIKFNKIRKYSFTQTDSATVSSAELNLANGSNETNSTNQQTQQNVGSDKSDPTKIETLKAKIPTDHSNKQKSKPAHQETTEQLNVAKVLPATTKAQRTSSQGGSINPTTSQQGVQQTQPNQQSSQQTGRSESTSQPGSLASQPTSSASQSTSQPQTSTAPTLQFNPVQIAAEINRAIVQWQTNLPTNSKIFITLGNSTNTYHSASGLSKTHSATINDLAPNTIYNYLIDANTNEGQNLKTSGQFKTLPKPKQNYNFSALGFAITATRNSVIAILQDPSLSNPKFTLTIKGPDGQTYTPAVYKNPGGNYVWETSALQPNTNYNYNFTLSDDNFSGSTNGVIKTAPGQ